MSKEYRCKKSFYIYRSDDNGMLTEKQFTVVKGSRWKEDTECKYRICGGPDTIRLDRIAPKKNEWLEVTKETLEKYFELVKN